MSRHIFFAIVVPAVLLCASQPWTRDYNDWTTEDARRVLEDSPWAQRVSASFGDTDVPEPVPMKLPGAAEAGMAGPKGVTDGRWDGGIGRNVKGGVPSLPVVIRWDSALPVREALSRIRGEKTYTADQAQKDYIITLIGLVPGGRYRDSGHLATQSQSGQGGDTDPQDPEQMLEGLMGFSRLMPRGKISIAPENVKLDADTGAVHLFFPRTIPIEAADREVSFATRFGSMTVSKKFRIKDLTYRGHLEL